MPSVHGPRFGGGGYLGGAAGAPAQLGVRAPRGHLAGIVGPRVAVGPARAGVAVPTSAPRFGERG